MVSTSLAIGIVVVIIVVAGIGYYALSGQTSGYSTYTTTPTSVNPYSTSAATTAGSTVASTTASPTTTTGSAPKVVNIIEREYSITPSTINVSSGETVILNVMNEGATVHTLYIDGATECQPLNCVTPIIAPGKNDTLTFTAPAAGSYPAYCTVGSHKDFGMQMTIVVS